MDTLYTSDDADNLADVIIEKIHILVEMMMDVADPECYQMRLVAGSLDLAYDEALEGVARSAEQAKRMRPPRGLRPNGQRHVGLRG